MTPAAFSELVKNPGLLRNYSLGELQELAMRHPYASTVYSMIALKAHLEGDSSYEHYLNQAAIRIPDRKRLYELIHSEHDYWVTEALPQLTERQVLVEDPEVAIHEPERVVEEERVEEVVEKTEPVTVPEEPQQEAVTEELNLEERMPLHIVREEEVEKTEEREPEPEFKTEPAEPAPVEEPAEQIELPEERTIDLPGAGEVLEALSALRHSNEALQSERENEEAAVSPEEKREMTGPGAHSFTEWLSLVSKGRTEPEGDGPEEPAEVRSAEQAAPGIPIAAELLEPLPEETEEEKEIEEIITSKQAKASLVEDDEMVTETLAQIYELQRKFDKAIKAYQRLSLKYPDKKAYFAGKIETLKNK